MSQLPVKLPQAIIRHSFPTKNKRPKKKHKPAKDEAEAESKINVVPLLTNEKTRCVVETFDRELVNFMNQIKSRLRFTSRAGIYKNFLKTAVKSETIKIIDTLMKATPVSNFDFKELALVMNSIVCFSNGRKRSSATNVVRRELESWLTTNLGYRFIVVELDSFAFWNDFFTFCRKNASVIDQEIRRLAVHLLNAKHREKSYRNDLNRLLLALKSWAIVHECQLWCRSTDEHKQRLRWFCDQEKLGVRNGIVYGLKSDNQIIADVRLEEKLGDTLPVKEFRNAGFQMQLILPIEFLNAKTQISLISTSASSNQLIPDVAGLVSQYLGQVYKHHEDLQYMKSIAVPRMTQPNA